MVNNGDVLSNIELGVGGQQQDVKKADESPEKSPRSNGVVRGGGSNKRRNKNFSESTDENFPVEYPDEQGILLSTSGSIYPSNFSLNETNRGQIVADHLPVPPDGGYGWIVVVCAFFCNFFVDGISNSFGPFMQEYEKAFGTSKAATSMIGSVLIGTYCLSGPISGGLLNRYGAKRIVIVGAILSAVAFSLSTLSPNIYVHCLLYGFFGGMGFGFIYLPAIVIVSQYFENKRALATGIAVAGSGFGTCVLPVLSKFLIEGYGWKVSVLVLAAMVLLACTGCGLLFRPLFVVAFDEEIEKQRKKMEEEEKQRNLFAVLNRAEDGLSLSGDDTGYPIASTSVRTESESEVVGNGQIQQQDSSSKTGQDAKPEGEEPGSPSRPQQQIPPTVVGEGGRLISKSRAGSQIQQADARDRAQGQFRTRKYTLTSMNSEMVSLAGQSRTNLNAANQLARISVRDYAQSISAISRASQLPPAGNIRAGESLLSVAMSGIDPKEFTRPLSRNDVFLQGSIRNLREFKEEGSNLRAYRESQISIPALLVSQNLGRSTSNLQLNGNIAETAVRFGGSAFGRIGGGGGIIGDDQIAMLPSDDSKFKWIPMAIRSALSQMLDLQLLREPVMLLLCLSNIFGMLGFYCPFVFIIDLAKERGITTSEATFLLSIIGFTNTFGRVFFGWVADRRWVDAITISNWSLLICGSITCICPLFSNYVGMTCYSVLFGFIVAAYVCLTSIVLTDLLGVEQLTNSFGLVVVSRGIASLAGTPIAGVVYDVTSSYDASFYVAGSLIIVAGLISCAIPLVHKHEKSKLKNEGDYEMPQKDVDAQSGRLSVVTERSEEEHTLTSMRQRRQLLKEFAEYQKKQEEGGAVHILLEEEDHANLDAAETEASISHRGEPRESTPERSRANHKENEGEEEENNDQANK